MNKFIPGKLNSILNHRPLVVGTLTGRLNLKKQLRAAAKAGVDLVEVRLDTFSNKEDIFSIRKIVRHPLLLTLRSPKEGGEAQFFKAFPKMEREKLLQMMANQADFLDVEIKAADASRLTRFGHSQKMAVIHSFHDFKKMPSPSILNALAKKSARLKGDFFKIAVKARDPHEFKRFLNWSLSCPHPKPVLIAMGEEGLASRTLGYCFGSTMTFGHLGKAAAPGQFPAGQLAKIIRNIFRQHSFR